MPTDFPAAHSMDTDWFALDDCGHVAYCRSGEAGAVPEGALQTDPDEDRDDFKPVAALPGKVVAMPFNDCDPAHLDLVARVFEGMHGSRFPDVEQDIFAYRPHPALIARLQTEELIIEYARDRVLIRLKPGPNQESLHSFIHSQGLCYCCGTLWWRDEGPWQFGDGTTSFFYSHVSGGAAPYLLKHAPKRAAVLDSQDLSPEQRAALQRASVKGCFRDRLFWQPAESLKCSIYGDSANVLRPHGTQFESLLRDYL